MGSATNHTVASLLQEVAERLALKGENPFRIRAYEHAARAIEDLPEDIGELAFAGQLEEIPGVGESIAAKIEEYLRSGRMTYLEGLREEFPEGVREVMHVPDVGPKLASQLYRELGIASIDQLEAAAQNGQLLQLPHIGQKTVDNILHGIARVRAQGSRRPIGEVLPLVETLTKQLAAHEFIHNVTVAGSIRRFRDTVGDIDLIATSAASERAMDVFTSLPEVRDVIMRGSTRATVITHGGVQVDLRVVPDENFGSLLQHFTGSKDHNVQLRDYALSKGLSLSEYGITDLKTNTHQTFRDETTFYAALGMSWIPPEIREASGEIEAALIGRLPRLIEVRDVKGDLQLHTDWSDGTQSLEAMVAAAAKRGYEYIAITDHSPMRAHAHGLSIERLQEQWELISRVQERYPDMRILRGAEVDIHADGTLDYPDDILAQLDWVVAAIHSSFNMSQDRMTARLLCAIEHPLVDAIAHPTGRLLGRRPPVEIDMEMVLATAAQTGTALEINSFLERLDLRDADAHRAIELGTYLVIDTDAHAAIHLDNIRFGVAVARRAWAQPDNVLNTKPLAELLAFRDWRRSRGSLDAKVRGKVGTMPAAHADSALVAGQQTS
jgi:DNA polymerase (family 10)